MKTIEDFIKEGKSLAEAQAAVAAQVASAFTGYDVFNAIRAEIPVRADLPPKGKPFSFDVIGIRAANIVTKVVDGNEVPSWAAVEVILKDNAGTVTLFGSDLVKAEQKIGMTLEDAGCIRISRSKDGVMSYAKV
jgi:hypothetical protein